MCLDLLLATNKMEKDGEKVYRLHHKIINKYVKLFIEAEQEWHRITCADNSINDILCFALTIRDWETRMCFFLDRLFFLPTDNREVYLLDIEDYFFEFGFFRLPRFLLSNPEDDLLLSVMFYLKINSCGYLIPKLTKWLLINYGDLVSPLHWLF